MTTKTRALKRVPAKKTVPAIPNLDDTEALDLVSVETEEVETIHLYTLDGREVHVRKHWPLGVALRLQETYGIKGEEATGFELMRTVLGDEEYETLRDWDGLTPDIFNTISDRIVALVMGGLERGKAS